MSVDVQPTVQPRLAPLFLDGSPDQVALVADGETTTYAALAAAVAETAGRLGPERRLVLLEAANDVRTVVTYLAALAGRHPVLLVGPGDATRHLELVETYDPDVVQTAAAGEPEERRSGTAHDLHPDLALLLSTSGSTGSPKLVRLSRTNLVENTRAIATYLQLDDTDRAVTTLPLHYCYGLSVINTHLAVGASVVLTELSVADECFWDLVSRHEVTGLAGVPYSYELLDASGFRDRDLPSLRYLTQAGGRMPPGRVRDFAELGRARGWDLFVMYGQTEATARMAFLPPDRAALRPESIGVPLPGGDLRLEPVPAMTEPGVGELVYTGPNVMMGYAEIPADLARGPELEELRTGDLARQSDDGLWEVVGRLNRSGKVFGVRLDLDRLERQLSRLGYDARVVVHDDRLQGFTTSPRARSRLATALARLASVPVGAVQVHLIDAVPLTPSQKTDYAALTRQAALLGAVVDNRADPPEAATRATTASVRDLYAALLGKPNVRAGDSFVSLGGDSLSFVEVSLRLGRHLGHLPQEWQHLTVEGLAATARNRRRLLTPLELPALLRAVAIILVVAAHADLWLVLGGAHVLLAVMGFNVARFALALPDRRQQSRRILSSVAAVAVPAAVWIAGCALILGAYRPTTALFLNQVVGDEWWTDNWQFWFLEALVWTQVGLAVLVLVPAVDRLRRRHAFGAAMGVVVLAVGLRFVWTGIEAGPTERYTTGLVLWCFALGWAAAEARTLRQRFMVTVAAVLGSLGFFGDLQREAIVAAAVILLVWVRSVPVPSMGARALGVVGAASLWIYLTHWQVYPGIEAAGHQVWAVLASVAVGIACWAAHERLAPIVRTHLVRRPGQG